MDNETAKQLRTTDAFLYGTSPMAEHNRRDVELFATQENPMKRQTKQQQINNLTIINKELRNQIGFLSQQLREEREAGARWSERAKRAEAINDHLLRILENGSKEGSFPRRSS
jgi:hypothetical protein